MQQGQRAATANNAPLVRRATGPERPANPGAARIGRPNDGCIPTKQYLRACSHARKAVAGHRVAPVSWPASLTLKPLRAWDFVISAKMASCGRISLRL